MLITFAADILIEGEPQPIYIVSEPIDTADVIGNDLYHSCVDTVIDMVTKKYPGKGLIIRKIEFRQKDPN